MPGISVIVPLYQAERFVEQCVESVRRQTYSDWELLLIDDGSTDATPALCDRLAEDPRIRVFHKPNGGVSSARNLGLREAAGEYIAFLDADDRFAPEALETMWQLLESTGADTAGCAHWNLTPAGERTSELLLQEGVYDRQGIPGGDRVSAAGRSADAAGIQRLYLALFVLRADHPPGGDHL